MSAYVSDGSAVGFRYFLLVLVCGKHVATVTEKRTWFSSQINLK